MSLLILTYWRFWWIFSSKESLLFVCYLYCLSADEVLLTGFEKYHLPTACLFYSLEEVKEKSCLLSAVWPQVPQAQNMSIRKHRHCCVTNKHLHGKKNRFCNLGKWKDFNKKQLILLKMCVTSLLCGPRADISSLGYLWFDPRYQRQDCWRRSDL